MAGRFSFGVMAAAMSADAREAAVAAHRAGFAGVQFDAIHPLDLTALSETGRREFKHVLRQQEQTLIALRTRTGLEGDLDQMIWRVDRIVETAAALGAKMVCLELTSPSNPSEKAAPYLSELGQRADRYGQTIAFSASSMAPTNLKQILTAAACPNFGIDFDPPAVLQAGLKMAQAVGELASDIRHLRGRDALVGPDQSLRPVAIGRGNIDWQKLLVSLDEAQYHGWITLDTMELPDRAAGAIAGLKALQRFV